jgi:hypothetical protein
MADAAAGGFGWLGDPCRFERLWRGRDQLLEEYFAMAKAQSAAFDAELAACVLIQRIWRGTSARLHFFERSFAVLTIQRIWRGFAGRLEYGQRLLVAQRKARIAYYAGMAATIQKHWRGSYSRKVRHDFYARKLFLQAIEVKNEELRATLQQHYEDQVEDVRSRTMDAARSDFGRLISDKHHLVSTVSQPGVFNSPFPGMQPTAFGEYVDDHLRRTVEGLTARSLEPPGSTGRLSSSRGFGSGKLQPGSVQAASPYDAVDSSNRADRRVSKAVRSQVSPHEFRPAPSSYGAPHVPSVHVGPQIVEPHNVLERCAPLPSRSTLPLVRVRAPPAPPHMLRPLHEIARHLACAGGGAGRTTWGRAARTTTRHSAQPGRRVSCLTMWPRTEFSRPCCRGDGMGMCVRKCNSFL